MKVAIIHDALIEFGGSERVLQALLKIFPAAYVYTSMFNQNIIDHFFFSLSSHRLHYSWIQEFPNNFKRASILQLLSPLIWQPLELNNYNIIFSNSSFMLSSLVKTKRTIHIQYINCIPKNLFGLEPPKRLEKIIPYTRFLASLYRKAIKSSPFIIANSKYTKNTLHNLFNVKSKVIYPPVNVPKFLPKKKKLEFFICVSRLDRTKNIELAIQACNFLNLPLKIVGRAIDLRYERFLKSISGPKVEFIGMRPDKEISSLYHHAIGFIFTAKDEDFGIAPVEAMAHGVPVIAYYGGGLKETMISGKTGEFFYEYTVDSLTKVIKNFDYNKYDRIFLNNHARKFSEEKFKANFIKYIRKAMK